jgi:hypothetical protein
MTSTVATPTAVMSPAFRKGDEVVLAEGTYQGTLGTFLGLKEDANWADITERNGEVRSHPVTWLAPASAEAAPASAVFAAQR